ncbi:MAG: virulence protein SciE type [Planctomycetota bacterium]|nr:MAG: virulence protein SciE type [Planctomycetota bacterium]
MSAAVKTAEDHLRAGRVDEALDALRDAIRSDPSDAGKRIFLFQLFCVLGQWDKALNQLNVAADLDSSVELMAKVGRSVLQCEAFRREVFAGRKSPLLLGEPEPWIGLMIQAVRLSGQGEHAKAADVRAEAFEAAEPIAGSITIADGEDLKSEAFAWIADADERLGPMIEAIIEGKYYWVPMSHIRSVLIEPPTDLRDLVWVPAQFTWVNGGEMVGLIPARYPGSEDSKDGTILLARKTEFVQVADDTYVGVGQRMWATDSGEFPILQTRQIELDQPGSSGAEGDG